MCIAISIVAVVLTLISELDLINGWLLSLNKGLALTFNVKFYFFRVVLGILIIILGGYKYIMWNLNQTNSQKKKELKQFIEIMTLAKGLR